ncbi:hypothetical protein JAAARDRAFT_34225 [Jaapia argillacea MUCL 33604]|uniref:WW domain-containing protein n=1 Tax=Jaapia argillacea MUCL 33604 TaxID=933084 RepID=A0A067Q783_9AGAM|nr:hypothetical protein JAAARDRAFT_34225 [Jaapia argillacea MUCL 33604]
MNTLDTKHESKAIADDRVLSLLPTTSVSTKRYVNNKLATPSSSIVPAGLFSYGGEPEPNYLPLGWSSHTNPEGRHYFVHGTRPSIVTEECLYVHETLARITYWISRVNQLLADKRIGLPDTVELFLELCEMSSSCRYYLIDHATRVEFWLEDASTDILELPQIVSTSHLKHKFEEHYWSHVEHFPMHLGGLKARIRDEIVGALVQGCTDQMTCDVAVFPYSREQCSQFLSLIGSTGSGDITDGNVIFTLARISSSIAQQKFNAHFGQEVVRYTRNESILGSPERKRSWLMAICSRILFGIPDTYVAKFEELYVDKLVHVSQWDTFISSCREEWKQLISWTFALLISQLLLLLNPSASRQLSLAGVLLCTAGLVSGASLLVRHPEPSHQPQALIENPADYFEEAWSTSFGYELLGSVFALPKALLGWVIALLVVEGLALTISLTSTSVAGGLMVAIALIALIIRAIVPGRAESPTFSSVWESLKRFCSLSRQKDTEGSCIV